MVGVISDIHSNLAALQAVLAEIDKLGCKKIICLGDIAGYYSSINECIDLLKEHEVYCLMGNHDYYLATGSSCGSRTVNLVIEYQKQIINDVNLNWIRNLPVTYDTGYVSCRHAGWNQPLEERFYQFDFNQVAGMGQRLYFSGHSHIQYIQKESGKIYCNPGAVGQPRDLDPRAGFAVYDESGQISIYRVEYDIDDTVWRMKKANLGEWIWEPLYRGAQIGK